MTTAPYRFLASLFTDEGLALGQCPVEPDWEPAFEAARFRALRLGASARLDVPKRIEPIWNTEVGQPYLQGAQVSVETAEGERVGIEVPLAYFRSAAQLIASEFIRRGALKDGEMFRYQITAFASPEEIPTLASGPGAMWAMVEVSKSPLCGERSLAAYLRAGIACGEREERDFPVFLPSAVLSQAETLMEQAGENETGGVLIGYLWRDTDTPEAFAEITALIPAQHTIQSSMKLTFTPQTWDAARAIAHIRNNKEELLGYWHSHPARHWCKCSLESQRECPLGKQFFSADDAAVQRAVFPQGYHVALVTGDSPLAQGGWERAHTLYGWRDGMIAARGFYLLKSRPNFTNGM